MVERMLERMMVAFGMSSPPAVLDLDGGILRTAFDSDPGEFVENLEDQFSERGMQGIYVWEGEPNAGLEDDEEGEDFGICDLRKGDWRAPTDSEWVALRASRSPFNSEVEDLGSLVE
jgi:hypothetical protein